MLAAFRFQFTHCTTHIIFWGNRTRAPKERAAHTTHLDNLVSDCCVLLRCVCCAPTSDDSALTLVRSDQSVMHPVGQSGQHGPAQALHGREPTAHAPHSALMMHAQLQPSDQQHNTQSAPATAVCCSAVPVHSAPTSDDSAPIMACRDDTPLCDAYAVVAPQPEMHSVGQSGQHGPAQPLNQPLHGRDPADRYYKPI